MYKIETSEKVSSSISIPFLLVFSAILLLGFGLRVPGITGEINGIHDWKNIRHYEFSKSMLRTGNPIFAEANFTQPEVSPTWYWYVTEAPWVDWSLVLVYLIFGSSIYVYQAFFVFLDSMTLVLSYLVFRRLTQPWLALCGMLLYAVVPMNVYFASYGIGESFIKLGQFLWILAAHNILMGRVDRRAWLLYFLACLNLAMCKLTTGTLMTFCGFAFGLILWVRQNTFDNIKQVTLGQTTIRFMIFGLLICFLIFVLILNYNLALIDFTFLSPSFIVLLTERWLLYSSLTLFVSNIVAALCLTVLLTKSFLFKKQLALSSSVKMIVALWAMTFFQMVFQARAYIPHEYYLVVFIVPSISTAMIFFEELRQMRRPYYFYAAFCVTAALFIWRIPINVEKIRALYRVYSIHKDDITALENFYRRRRDPNRKTFVITEQPRWAFHADIYAKLVLSHEQLLGFLRRTDRVREFLLSLNKPYVLLTRNSVIITPEIQEQLDHNLVVDLGPEYYKLGVVLRGIDFYLLKITDGVQVRRAIGQELLPDTQNPFWIFSESAFKELSPSAESTGHWFRSEDMDHGALYTYPFPVEGDAISYEMGGSVSPAIHVDLYRDGEMIFQHSPRGEEYERYTFDIAPYWRSRMTLVLVDNFAWENSHLTAGGFELVSYSDPLK